MAALPISTEGKVSAAAWQQQAASLVDLLVFAKLTLVLDTENHAQLIDSEAPGTNRNRPAPEELPNEGGRQLLVRGYRSHEGRVLLRRGTRSEVTVPFAQGAELISAEIASRVNSTTSGERGQWLVIEGGHAPGSRRWCKLPSLGVVARAPHGDAFLLPSKLMIVDLTTFSIVFVYRGVRRLEAPIASLSLALTDLGGSPDKAAPQAAGPQVGRRSRTEEIAVEPARPARGGPAARPAVPAAFTDEESSTGDVTALMPMPQLGTPSAPRNLSPMPFAPPSQVALPPKPATPSEPKREPAKTGPRPPPALAPPPPPPPVRELAHRATQHVAVSAPVAVAAPTFAPSAGAPPDVRSELLRRVAAGVSLAGLDLRRASLRGVALPNANLNGLDLSLADLSDADLSGASLDGCQLSDARLAAAKLDDATLKGACLDRASLKLASLRGARMSGCSAVEADLTSADLERANLRQAKLTGATLSLANLRASLAEQVDLTGADLSGAHFEAANLRGSVLRRAIVTRARFTAADLSGADLREAEPHKAFHGAELGNTQR